MPSSKTPSHSEKQAGPHQNVEYDGTYKDRDPVQREAEGQRSSMDYSEVPLVDFLSTKKARTRARPYACV